MCRVCGCYRGGIVVMDMFCLALTLCKYDLRKGDERGGDVSLQIC